MASTSTTAACATPTEHDEREAQQDNFLAVHNWWHLALHHLARGDGAAAMKLYDGPIHGHRPGVVAELIDASALLWRAELLGCG